MQKKQNYNSKDTASFAARPSTKFQRVSLKILRLLLIIAFLIAAFPWLYEIKTKAGINIVPGIHAGPFFEKYTHGIVKCEWFYPYDCHQYQAKSGSLNRG
jgi:hypothetical protein